MKPGYKTTEFWLTVAIAALTLLGALPLGGNAEVYVSAGLAAAYAVSRGLAKLGKGGSVQLQGQPVLGAFSRAGNAMALADPQIDQPDQQLQPRPISDEPEVSP